MRKVFISHSWEDNETSRKLAEYLKRDGADIWIDYTRIHGGDSLPRRISEALEWCDTLVLLWSKSAKDSYYVNLEWENALDLQKNIIPCLLDETKRPAILSRCLYIDFKNIDNGYRLLCYALDLEFQKEAAKKATPFVIEKSNSEINSHGYTSTNQRMVKPEIFFRSKPATLSSDDVHAMLRKFDFFDSAKNKEGRGFDNQYKAEKIKDDMVVIDEIFGLMWQQGGSLKNMGYEEAKTWIGDLNKKGYAGYQDWRLPTLEEAMSLMESKEMNGDLFIDPKFDRTQRWIWTCDPVLGTAGRQWIVDFHECRCDFNYLSDDFYFFVRAVRFGQSDKSD
ncbi:TIR domain-containing protein [candidate division KSB1 bacterium]|nr:TIR domain-containing protein [candidate division KSB1 bacterium]